MTKAAKAMAALGEQQRAAVDHSIANGCQGLFAPNGESNGRRIHPRPGTYEHAAAAIAKLETVDDDEAPTEARSGILGRNGGDVRRQVEHQLRGDPLAGMDFGPDDDDDGRAQERDTPDPH
jgi:hypothetical protein